MPVYLEMSKNITQQWDIYDTVYIFYIYIFFLLFAIAWEDDKGFGMCLSIANLYIFRLGYILSHSMV